ncbi:helix-turn-helix domain-containing protein [Nonomuraea rubra]|uniref:helix-turn-helix domain-containing protein n=1 Tax=Nonomuraea rubra TaxID=46180 RepID=UPI00361AE096
MMGLGADRVIVRDSVVLNPHYRTMGLFGSEYWTYVLPRRVGAEHALRLTQEALPIGAVEAVECGLADKALPGSRLDFERRVLEYAERLAADAGYDRLLAGRRQVREVDERRKPLDAYRAEELAEMSRDMFDDRGGFRLARREFVLKVKASATPERLAGHRGLSGASPAGALGHLICEIWLPVVADDYLVRIGRLIRDARQHRGWTQLQLADALATSQSAVNRIERGNQNISLEMIARIGEALDSEIVSLGYAGPMHLRVVGGRRLSGSIDVKTSKNACVALLCASLLNSGRTILRKVARIEEVYRILEVLASIGVRARWINEGSDLEIVPPSRLELEAMDTEAARRTRSVIMFLGPLMHRTEQFQIPYAGGCDLGTRTVQPHMSALRHFGLDITATGGFYHARVDRSVAPSRPIVLTERGDTVTENALLAAARHDGVTVIRNASSNYMVQDLCFFLEQLGVRVEGIGSTTLTVHGLPEIERDVDYSPRRIRWRR